jgi:hypothetical protein
MVLGGRFGDRRPPTPPGERRNRLTADERRGVGAIITFAFLVYALWKYRDPKVKNRRYG